LFLIRSPCELKNFDCGGESNGVLFALFGAEPPNRHFFTQGLTIQGGEP
jgi:hypothetical protein